PLHAGDLAALAIGLGELVRDARLLVLEEAYERGPGDPAEDAEEEDQVDGPVQLVGQTEEGLLGVLTGSMTGAFGRERRRGDDEQERDEREPPRDGAGD